MVDLRTGEEAINRGLAKRLDQLANERERREKAARAEDENFSVEFLSAARKVFEMIDVDESGTLEKEEVVVAIRGNKKVINFLVNCGNKNLQYLLVPARLDAALNAMDTDRDGHIDADEWEECIEIALKNKLADRAAKRSLDAARAAKEIEEFTNEFKNAARECFQLIDKDHGGSLSKQEMSARCVRPSTRARRGDGAAALAVRRVWGGSSYAIDATRRLPRDPLAASTPSEATRR